MIQFLMKYPDKIVEPFLQHIQITLITLALSFVIAAGISFLIMRSRVLSQVVIGIFSAVYAIPSLALFALLVPLLGLGETAAIVVLTAYNQFILVRNIIAGFHSISPSILEAANGMGMSQSQSFFRIRLPLASPVILAGIKVSVTTTIGIATIASTINAGGLGDLLFDGLRTQNMVKILWGTLLASLLAVAANLLLGVLEKRAQQFAGGIKV